MTAPLFQLELPIRPAWVHAEGLRLAVIACLESAYLARDACETYGMVVGELVENAIKYGRWDSGHPLGSVRVTGNTDEVRIEVTHQAMNEQTTASLMAFLEQLRSAPSPEAAYLATIEGVAHRAANKSGLGLARVAFEACCQLSAQLHPEGQLTVLARIPTPGKIAVSSRDAAKQP
jgi:hypothetical protein